MMDKKKFISKLAKAKHGWAHRRKLKKTIRKRLISNQEMLKKQDRQTKADMKKLRHRQLFRKYLDKAGYEDLNEQKITTQVFHWVLIICLICSTFILGFSTFTKPGVSPTLTLLAGVWTGIFAGLFVLFWLMIYLYLDLRIFNRTMQVEEVLPDFLQLTSANISAGMTIDRALWFAVRPRFGVLAKEIEDVAKSTISGEDLKVALTRFGAKYDSVVLQRSINLLLEGMNAGGEIADLLNRISLNIQETKILKKEMAANVMTYVLFIGFATVVAAPILFGLAGQLLLIIQQIMGLLAIDPTAGGGAGSFFTLDFSADSVSITDFRIFSLVTLFITAMFSSFIISVIRKGSIKEGLKFIPVFIVATLLLYFLSSWVLNLLLGNIIHI